MSRNRQKDILRKYGISLFEYDLMFQAQKGCCRICGIPQSYLKQRLSIDHDHKTDRIRGLLCNTCNVALGSAHDNPALLRRMAEYLEHNSK